MDMYQIIVFDPGSQPAGQRPGGSIEASLTLKVPDCSTALLHRLIQRNSLTPALAITIRRTNVNFNPMLAETLAHVVECQRWAAI